MQTRLSGRVGRTFRPEELEELLLELDDDELDDEELELREEEELLGPKMLEDGIAGSFSRQ